MNNLLKSHALYKWYGTMRDKCMQPKRLWTSVTLTHEPVFLARTPCHNSDIFEGLFQTDVATSLLISALGGRLAGAAALLLWAPSVHLEWSMADEFQTYTGAGHGVFALLPSALATLLFAALLPGWLFARRCSGSLSRFVVGAFAVALILAAMVQDSAAEFF